MANHCCTLPRTTMDTDRNRVSDKSVKETLRNLRGLSPGREGHAEQVTPDHNPATAANNMKNLRKRIKIGTWNVNTLYQPGKLSNVIKEMKRLEVNIMGTAEARWTGSGKFISEKYTIIYAGEETHKGGVALIMDEDTAKCCKEYWAVSPRVLLVKIQAKPFNINIIQVYAPTNDHTEKEVDTFYQDLVNAMKTCKSQDIIMVMGDLNAKVGKGPRGKAAGPHGLGERNERGDRWVEWCEGNNMIITNTWFQNHPRRIWTWKSPGDSTRNQIDYITISKRFRNAVKHAKCYPGADCGSDHAPVIANLELKLKKIKDKTNGIKYDWNKLGNNVELAEDYKERLTNRFKGMDDEEDVDNKWRKYKEALKETTKELVPRIEAKAKQPWMTKEILDLMEERRKVKSTDRLTYQALNKQIKMECKMAKEKWLNAQCEEIENHKRNRNIHDKIRELSGKKRGANSSNCVTNKEGDMLTEEEDIMKRWEEYLEQLYKDERTCKPNIKRLNEGPTILREEVEQALKEMKKKKASGPDEIVIEMILTAGEEGISRTTEMINLIYETGVLPTELGKSIIIPIPKNRMRKNVRILEP